MKFWNFLQTPVSIHQIFLLISVMVLGTDPGQSQFRIAPYLQNVTENSITIIWWSPDNQAGTLEWGTTPKYGNKLTSTPIEGSAISTIVEGVERPDKHPYRHEANLSSLRANTTYHYCVTQGESKWQAQFITAAGVETDFSFAIGADPESKSTEPERNKKHRALLRQIHGKNPRFLIYAGDLVDQGNAQDDWDSFWSDLIQENPADSIASFIPIYSALGNHDYDGLNTTLGGNRIPYAQPFSEMGVTKYLEYFSLPVNNLLQGDPRRERFYRIKYGALTIIVLDTNNDSISSPDPAINWDTNRYSSHSLTGENEPPEPGGQGFAPDIHGEVDGVKDSLQYQWLVKTLQEASRDSAFIFVIGHQAPYSSFVHGAPDEEQSGYPLRKLDRLFHYYGVDAVFSGHDESYERSLTEGTRAGGAIGDHKIHYFVLPTIGDVTGLRDPSPEAGWQVGFSRFIFPLDNKNFGYLGIEIQYKANRQYQATITPYYLDSLSPSNSNLFYDDVVRIQSHLPK
jgi:hypothetical protein